MSFIDQIIIIIFLLAISIYGLIEGKKNKSSKDFFLGTNSAPWWVAMLSIVATETSVLTFMYVPGFAYRGDWYFLQLAMGYILGRILVSIFLIPQYFNMGFMSIYEVIGQKFGPLVQKIASITFLITVELSIKLKSNFKSRSLDNFFPLPPENILNSTSFIL